MEILANTNNHFDVMADNQKWLKMVKNHKNVIMVKKKKEYTVYIF